MAVHNYESPCTYLRKRTLSPGLPVKSLLFPAPNFGGSVPTSAYNDGLAFEVERGHCGLVVGVCALYLEEGMSVCVHTSERMWECG